HCGSIRIIRNGSYTTRTQMLKVKEKLTILELKRTRFLCHDCGRILREATKHYQPRMNFLPTVLCMDE
ncbi:transposase family protein, partial [Enterococcus avium]